MNGELKSLVWLERLVALFISTGVAFKLFSWPGASVLVIASGLLFLISVIIKIFNNFKNTNKNIKQKLANFFTIFSGLAIAVSIIFKQQHWAGFLIIFILGVLSLSIAIVLTNWRLDLKKRHIVISVTFIFWVMTGFIYNVEHEQFTDEIGIQIESLRKISENKLALLPDTNNQKQAIQKFYTAIDQSIYTLISELNQVNLSEAAHVYPLNIPYPSHNLYDYLIVIPEGFPHISLQLKAIFNQSQYIEFCKLNNFGAEEIFVDEIPGSYKIPEFMANQEIDGSFIYYAWFLERLKLKVVNFFSIKDHKNNLDDFIENSNTQLLEYTKEFIYRQGQLRISLIISSIFLIFSLYLDRFGLKIRYQKPLVFFAVFAFLEFVLLTSDPVLQLYIDNGYIISAFEVGLAALVIPFHSMVEHNLYQKNKHDA